jgi:hypothetical protein
MKKLFTLSAIAIILSLLAGNLMAFNSSLQISSTYSQFITVQIGNTFYSNPTNLFQMNTLAPGTYNVTVYRWQRGLGNQFPIYNGFIQVGANEMVHTIITAPGFAQINRQVIIPQCNTVSPVIQPFHNTYTYPFQQNYFGMQGLQNYSYNSIMPMDIHSFAALKQSIARASFESTRLDIARQVIAKQYITAVQLRELLQLFTFESSKVEFAKFAYPQVIDRQNIFTIYDAFTFNSSISELSRYFN